MIGVETRTQQIVRSQDVLLQRLLADRRFARRMSRHPLHASVGGWLSVDLGKRVLELGCGPGKYVAMLSTLGFEVTGVDPHRFPSWDLLERATGATLLDGTFAESLPFGDGAFDGVACLGALLYFADARKAVAEIRRVLRPEGRAVIRTVNERNLYTMATGRRLDPASKNLYTMEALTRLLEESGLVVERSFACGFWPPCSVDLWWYLTCVWLPFPVQAALGRLLPQAYRLNNVAFASVPGTRVRHDAGANVGGRSRAPQTNHALACHVNLFGPRLAASRA